MAEYRLNIAMQTGFNEMTAANPELIAAYFTFVWTYGAANNEWLANLQVVRRIGK